MDTRPGYATTTRTQSSSMTSPKVRVPFTQLPTQQQNNPSIFACSDIMANAIVANLHCCKECGTWMKKDHRTIIRHLNEAHKDTGKGMFVCPICVKPFTRQWTLSRHSLSIHKFKINTSNSITPSLIRHQHKKNCKSIWSKNYQPLSVTFRVLYGNNSPYPSCLQPSVTHPPRTVALLPLPHHQPFLN